MNPEGDLRKCPFVRAVAEGHEDQAAELAAQPPDPAEPVVIDWLIGEARCRLQAQTEEEEPHDVIEFNEVTRFCPGCGADLVGNDPCTPDCPSQSTPVVDKDLLGTCVDCGAPCHIHMRRCQWCAALKHLA